ncbi:SH3 domain-containing protein [Xanthomarina sp. F2636L]|uniref:SH3 domain-containing protein n=1 Tax=Xanthomarina sp. F2636L TaxID=2996018 RepID=UPI00225E50C0|nr:SH3 domain-containing protein [Xanthomarina sp. F2636L]MCX7549633.1 SH3 domain-containing protein [Xanthomarina sp. F2636L]
MKNVKSSILGLCLVAMSTMFGQTTPQVNFATAIPSSGIDKVSYQYLLANDVYLRQTPSLKGKTVALLPIGTKLVIQEKSKNEDSMNGIKSHWYRVSIGQDSGWIWGGLIAQKTFGSEASHNIKFAYGFESATINDEGVLEQKHQLRAFKNGVQIDKIVFNGHQAMALKMKNIGNKGLFNVEDIIALDIPGANGEGVKGKMYIFWNNGKFTNVASLVNHSDASYTKTESFIFPSDMEGVKSRLVLETFITDHYTTTQNECPQDNKRLIISHYKWNGYKLVKMEDTPKITGNIVSADNKITNNF